MKDVNTRRGQAGFEFLAVTALGLFMVVLAAFFLLGQSANERDTAAVQQAQQALSVIANQAERVWSEGRNSWHTVELTLPENTQGLYTVENNTIVVEVGTGIGLIAQPRFMRIPVTGGYDVVGPRSNAFPTGQERGGPIRIRVENNGTTVLLMIE